MTPAQRKAFEDVICNRCTDLLLRLERKSVLKVLNRLCRLFGTSD